MKAATRLAPMAVAFLSAGCDLPRDSGGTSERVRSEGLRAGITEQPPWTERTAPEPSGIEVDLVRGFARELGAEVHFTWGAEQRLFERLERDELDLARVVEDLMDRAPTHVERDTPHELRDRLQRELGRLDWVKRVGVRLREEGHVLCGEVFLVPHHDRRLLERLEKAREIAQALDWRLFDLVVTAVPRLPGDDPAGAER